VGWLFQIVWTLFRLTVWSLMLVLFSPRTLEFVGWDGVARWLLHHAWARWVGLPLLLPFFLLSAFTFHERRSGDGEPDCSQPGLDPELGLREGSVSRWPVDDNVIEAATWSRGGSHQCVATATVAVPPGFAFSARSSRMEPVWFRGAAQGAVRMGIERARKIDSGAHAEVWDTMAFLSDDPVDMTGIIGGESVVLRTSQPVLARTVFSDPEVGRVIGELEQADRQWEWSLLPDGHAGQAVLRFACRGRAENPEVAAWAQALMSTSIRRLAA